MKNGDIFYHSYRFHDTKDQDGAHHPKVFIFLSFNSDCSSLIPLKKSSLECFNNFVVLFCLLTNITLAHASK